MKEIQDTPTATDYYNQVSDYYDGDAGDFDQRYWNNPVLQQIRQSFRQEVKRFSGNHMLEIGCGTGLDLVHFSALFPERKLFGIDISARMVRLSQSRLEKNERSNIQLGQGSVEDVPALFPGQRFDIIYVFFGALNTVESLPHAARALEGLLSEKGVMVLTFVNKWYLAGMIIEMLRLRFKRAYGRLNPLWGGYSPSKFLPSHCYSPQEIKKAFKAFTLVSKQGYSILHPAWYFTTINQKLGKWRKYFWKADLLLNKTFLWRYGEYTMFVFKK